SSAPRTAASRRAPARAALPDRTRGRRRAVLPPSPSPLRRSPTRPSYASSSLRLLRLLLHRVAEVRLDRRTLGRMQAGVRCRAGRSTSCVHIRRLHDGSRRLDRLVRLALVAALYGHGLRFLDLGLLRWLLYDRLLRR